MSKTQHEKQIYLHFTNYKVSWGGKSLFKSTGFVESILENGLRPFSNVGCGDVVQQLINFVRHGCRTNKKRVHGVVSVPAVIVIEGTGLQVQQGYDADNHLQVNEAVSPHRILGWFEWNPIKIQNLQSRAGVALELRDPKYHELFVSKVQEVLANV